MACAVLNRMTRLRHAGPPASPETIRKSAPPRPVRRHPLFVHQRRFACFQPWLE